MDLETNRTKLNLSNNIFNITYITYNIQTDWCVCYQTSSYQCGLRIDLNPAVGTKQIYINGECIL